MPDSQAICARRIMAVGRNQKGEKSRIFAKCGFFGKKQDGKSKKCDFLPEKSVEITHTVIDFTRIMIYNNI